MKIKLEGNSYVVYDDDEEYETEFDRATYGDEIAKELARTYIDGYRAGQSNSQ